MGTIEQESEDNQRQALEPVIRNEIVCDLVIHVFLLF